MAPLAVWQALAVEEFNAAAAAALTEALRAAGEDAANAVYTSDGETLPLLQHAVHMESLDKVKLLLRDCLLYTSPSPRDQRGSRMPSSA